MHVSYNICLTFLSLSLTADLIGPNCESGAFVYGSMSLTDKVSNGIAAMLIQLFIPGKDDCLECREYYRSMLFYVCGGAALLGAAFMLTLLPCTVGERWRDRQRRRRNDAYADLDGAAASASVNNAEAANERTPLIT